MRKFLVFVGVLTTIGFVLAGCGSGNQAPTVSFVSPKDADKTTSKKVSFEVKGEDKDLAQGQKLTYTFDYGDGKSDKDTQNVKMDHQYDKAGSYTVKVTATDDKKAKSKEASIKITVQNAAPTADAKATPEHGPSPLTVAFDASGSKDADGQIASYEWDFGDGQKGSGQKVNHDYKDVKAYTVTLTVTDNDGAKSAPKSITVTAEAPSTGKVWEVHMMATADGKFQFEPAMLKINPGDTVRWLCMSGCPHSAMSYSTDNKKAQGIPAGGKGWKSELLNPDGAFEVKFDANAPQGSYAYYCMPHELLGQVGLIVVGKYTELSADFISSLPGPAKTNMQQLIELAKK